MNEWLRMTPYRFMALAVIGAVATWYVGQQTFWYPWTGRDGSHIFDGGLPGFLLNASLALWISCPLAALFSRWLPAMLAAAPFPIIWWLDGLYDAPITVSIALLASAMVLWWRSRLCGVGLAVCALVPVVGYISGASVLYLPFNNQVETHGDDTVSYRLSVLGFYAVAFAVCLVGAELLRRGALRDRRTAELEARSGEVERESVVTAERARLARDLHDVVAHHVSLIAVRAETAPYTVPDLTPAAREVLSEIANDSRKALDELRGVLGVLRRAGDAPRLAPLPDATQIGELIDQARGVGSEIRWQETDLTSVTASAGHVGYRVVQEALTNARRHSPGAPIAVTTVPADGGLVVRIANTATAEPVEGRGLTGMRERVESVGGALIVRREGAELVVHAEIPAEGR